MPQTKNRFTRIQDRVIERYVRLLEMAGKSDAIPIGMEMVSDSKARQTREGRVALVEKYGIAGALQRGSRREPTSPTLPQ